MQRALNTFLLWLRPAFVLLLAGCAATAGTPEGASVSSREPVVSSGLVDPLASRGSTETIQAQARQLFVRGMTRAFLQDHREAIRLYEEALRLAPDEAAILSAVAASHEALQDLSTALFYAQQAYAHDPENAYYGQHLADLYQETGQADLAVQTYERVLANAPRNTDALQKLARLQSARGAYRAALDTYARLQEVAGEKRAVQNQMLHLYLRLGDDAGVERLLERMLEQHPAEGTLRRMLSDHYAKAGRLQEAAAVLETGLQYQPEEVELQTALSELYRRMGAPEDAEKADARPTRGTDAAETSLPRLVAEAAARYARAGEDAEARTAAARLLDRALALDPNHAEALLLLGRLRYDARDYAEAADLLYRALQQNPRDPQRWEQAAAAYFESGNLDRAAEVAEEALLLFPGQVGLLRIAARALLATGRDDAAIEHFEEALRILREEDPQSAAQADLLSSLGLLYSRKGQAAAADSLYRSALAADPDHAPALHHLAYSLAVREVRLEEALRLARRAVAVEPQNPSFLDTLGWVYYKMGQLQQAKEWIGKSIASGATGAAVLEHYGDVLSGLGAHAEARRYWKQALDQNPESRRLQDKLRRHP